MEGLIGIAEKDIVSPNLCTVTGYPSARTCRMRRIVDAEYPSSDVGTEPVSRLVKGKEFNSLFSSSSLLCAAFLHAPCLINMKIIKSLFRTQ